MGLPRPDLGAGFRVFRHKPYIVVYRELEDTIEILRLVDGRRDYRGLF